MRTGTPLARHLCSAIALLALAVLYLPLLAVLTFSVNRSRFGVSWEGFTLEWYRRMFDNPAILSAGLNTILLALVSTAIATVLGTLLALGLARYPWCRRAAALFDTAVYLPVVTPDIIFAVALVIVFAVLRALTGWFQNSLLTMILSHVTFQISFVALVVRARLATIGPSVQEAARDLYASSSYILRKVTLPLLAPGILAGALLAATLSLDDFVISFLNGTNTLPIYIYSSAKRGLSPEAHAVSTLIFLATVALVVAGQLLAMLSASANERR